MRRSCNSHGSYLVFLLLVTLLVGRTSAVFADVMIGGIPFADNAFADVLISATPTGSGQFFRETSGSSQSLTLPADFAVLEAAVVGADLTQWASLRTSQAQLTVGFTDMIPTDGPGFDLAIFEIGVTAAVSVTIEGTTLQMHSQPAGDVNLILLDLSDFGVASTQQVTIGSSDIFNDIAGFGVIHGVPEPSSIGLAALGLAALAVWGRRRREGINTLSGRQS